MEWEEILAKLLGAKAHFMEADRELLVINANERSMTHKYAEYLQREFPDWNVDCEYNRIDNVPKQLRWLVDIPVSPADEDGQTVFPDIIIHRRRERKNLLVIEAKKSRNQSDLDRQKLEAFMSDERYAYTFAVILRFVIDDPYDVTLERCHPR